MGSLEIDDNDAKFQVRSYRPGQIRINDRIFTNSIIVSSTNIIENWKPQSIEELTADSLTPIIALKPNILLIGTGSQMHILKPHIYGELINHKIGVEFMDTSAACRTYNALTAEHRNVVAALIIR